MAMRKIVVVPYDPKWNAAFAAAASDIKSVFGPELAAIHHIGSTAVPGLEAKPVVDLLVVVHDIEQVDGFNPAMAGLGYEALGENGITGRRYFIKGGDEARSHNVHVFQSGHSEIEQWLCFRDYLRAHPAKARHYGRLKVALAGKFPQDICRYLDGKNDFIKTMIAQARLWSRNQGRLT